MTTVMAAEASIGERNPSAASEVALEWEATLAWLGRF